MTHLAVPQPALSKRGSLTPSVRRLLSRYPPAILEDNTPPERIAEQEEAQPAATREQASLPLTSFDRRFPQGYKVADVSIPLHPEEVPPGSENIFSPEYNPICRRMFMWGFLCPLLWSVGAAILIWKRIGLNSIMDPKVYWARVQWLKLNAKYGTSCAIAFAVVFLILIVIILVIKNYIQH